MAQSVNTLIMEQQQHALNVEPFPFIYLNMAGEMIYIIEQRLIAQSVDEEKATKGKRTLGAMFLCSSW